MNDRLKFIIRKTGHFSRNKAGDKAYIQLSFNEKHKDLAEDIEQLMKEDSIYSSTCLCRFNDRNRLFVLSRTCSEVLDVVNTGNNNSEFIEKLNPQYLADWFMFHGWSLDRRKSIAYRINFVEFRNSERLQVIRVLSERFGIKTSIHYSGRDGCCSILYVWTRSSKKFKDLIEPFVHPSLKYKLER